MLPANARVLRFPDRSIVFDDRTGRMVVLAARRGTDDRALADDPRVVSAGMLTPLCADRLVPHRKARPVLLPARMALLVPDPTVHPPGGHPWRLEPLDVKALAVWSAIDGRRSVSQIAERHGIAVEEVLDRLAALARYEVQAVQLRPERLPASHPQLSMVVGPPRAANRRSPEMYDRRGTTRLGAFHEAIDDAETRFDRAETTLAHAFGEPHPALNGRRWGDRLAEVLARLVDLDRSDATVLEVGGGTGELAAAFLAVRPVRYVRVDRSPALLAAQARLAPRSEGHLGDATALPIADASVDLVIANEVVADLPASREDGRWRNVGAEAFVRECARVLRPGGVAYLSEFGDDLVDPEETTQLDHPEVSIDFGALVRVSAECGLLARLAPLADVMRLDLDARWLWRPHLGAVRTLDALHGRPATRARAWTPDTLALPEPVEGLRWVSLHEEGPGPLPARFCALVVTRPNAR